MWLCGSMAVGAFDPTERGPLSSGRTAQPPRIGEDFTAQPRLSGATILTLDPIFTETDRPPAAVPPDALLAALAADRCGTWHWDVGTDRVRWDRALSAAYGIPHALAPRSGQDFLALVHPDDRERVVKTVAHCLEGGDAVEHDFRALVDGRVRLIHDRSHVLRDRSRRPIAMIGLCVGVTDEGGHVRSGSDAVDASIAMVDAGEYLQDVSDSLRRAMPDNVPRSLTFHRSSLALDFDRAVKLGMIVCELVAEATGGATRGRITVALRAEGDAVSLTLAEDEAGTIVAGLDRPDAIGAISIAAARALGRQLGGVLAPSTHAGAAYFGTVYLGRVWRLAFPIAATAA
jgi:PAS domain-containing protein